MIEHWLVAQFGNLTFTSNHEDARVNCPFCEAIHGLEDTGRHLYVSLVKPAAYCFRCNWKGHWIGLIISVEGCSYAEALGYIAQPVHDIARFTSLHSPRGMVQTVKLTSRPDDFQPLTFNSFDQSHEYRAIYAYARRRLEGISNRLDLIHTHFGWVQGSNRLWILVGDSWWQGRTIIGEDPKYIGPPWPKGDSLWNGEALNKYSNIVICEGVFSAIHVGRNAIALCAKVMGKDQAARIAESGVTGIKIMLDADALTYAYEMAHALECKGYFEDIEIHQLDRGDPCDSLEGVTVEYTFEERIKHVLKNV